MGSVPGIRAAGRLRELKLLATLAWSPRFCDFDHEFSIPQHPQSDSPFALAIGWCRIVCVLAMHARTIFVG